MVTRIVVFIFSLNAFAFAFAQTLECGTPEPTIEQLQRFRNLGKGSAKTFDFSQRNSSTTSLAMAAHVIRRDDGSGGLTEAELQDALDNVNNYYAKAGLSFFLLTINYIDETKYFDFVTSDEPEMTGKYNYDQTINVYFANSVGNGEGGFFCGYAYFPGGPDVILMDNGCTMNGSTFPHEIGHFFALYHTHGRSNSELTDELVTRGAGANCDSAGAQLCDTEADPNVSGKIDGSCNYVGTDVDANGDSFTPDAHNIMSYSLKQCRDVFSDGQYSRMFDAYTSNRNYLRQTNYIVDFTYDLNTICSGQQVSFTSTSVNADSFQWTFEGGTPATSTEENPVVVYNEQGAFNVQLTITSGGNTDVKTVNEAVRVEGELSSNTSEYAGSFEESTIQERLINEDNSITWASTSSSSSEGNKAAFMDFFNYNSSGALDYLVFAVLNTTEQKSFDMTFDYAYAAYSETFYDGLEVVFKGSCETTWESVFFKEGAELQTAQEFSTSLYVPVADDWIQETISFDVRGDQDYVEVAFKARNGYGNNLYIDNYAIQPSSGGGSVVITNVTVTDASCPDSSDGSLIINANGESDLQYSLDGSGFQTNSEFGNLSPGEYTITVRDLNQNETSTQAIVGVENDYPATPVIEVREGELAIDVSSEQSVQWYRDGELLGGETGATISDVTSGSYAVEVSNGSCASLSEDFIVTLAAIERVDISNASCPDTEDGGVEVIVTGTEPIEYSIDGMNFVSTASFNDLLPGNYEITIRNIVGVPVDQTVEVLFSNDYPEKPVIMEDGVGLSIEAESDQLIQWYLNDAAIAGATEPTISNLSAGIYTVSVSNGACATFSDPYEIVPLGVENEHLIQIFPNPVEHTLNVQFEAGVAKPEGITINDLAGKEILDLDGTGNVDVSKLKSGIYLIQFQSAGQNIVKRFVKH